MSVGDRKYVFAHFMVGNTYPYSLDDWKEDIALAHGHELDGFVLNVGKEEWQRERVADCLAAASELKLPFQFFLSFDMSSFPANHPQDVGLLSAYLTGFAQHPYMFVYRGRVVVSTFAGESSFYGYSTLNEAWNFARKLMEAIVPIHFIPSFFVDTEIFPSLTSIDGAFNWNGGWPVHLNPKCTRREIELPEFHSDRGYLNHLCGLTYMAAVSPWFFTHYGPDTWNKNWVYRCDDWLLVRRWEHLIRIRKDVDIVQVISWNDYGESHYIGPIKGAQPNSEAWVNGYPHTAWLPLNAYFAEWFKEGLAPLIQKDRVFLWARPHRKGVPTEDKVPRPDNWELGSTPP